MLRDYPPERTARRPRVIRGKRLRYAAVLVDFENIYFTLAEASDQESDDQSVDVQALDDGVELLSNLRNRLRHRFNAVMAIGRSYADYDRIGGDAQSQLQLLAFEPRFMLGNENKRSSSDILLSIDAVELLHTRPEIDLFVIVAGDRDYLPVVRRLREHLKRVILVGFEKSTSGDLRQVVGEENFFSAERLLPSSATPYSDTAESNETTPQHDAAFSGHGDGDSHDEEDDSDDMDLHGDGGGDTMVQVAEGDLKMCMEELLNAFYQYGGRKVWLTPFLRLLNDRFPYLDNRGRKKMVEGLQARGAIRIEKIDGDPYPYSVVEINWEDNWVMSMDEGRGNA